MFFFLVGLVIALVLYSSLDRRDDDRMGWVEIAIAAIVGTTVVLWFMLFHGML